jgi:aldehyde dehydrogenase (NAD+)
MTEVAATYIAGKWTQGDEPTLTAFDSTNGEVLATAAEATAADVDEAVRAAAAALADWSATPAAERAEHIRMLAARVAERGDELAGVMVREVGTVASLSAAVQVGGSVGILEAAARVTETYDYAAKMTHDAMGRTTVTSVVREPVGVVACITPWNWPLMQLVSKVGYAIAAGCTVVAKPSELCLLSTQVFTEAVSKSSLPKGVINIVNGTGPATGEALVRHPGIDAVSFTGSTAAGHLVAAAASGTLKRVSLELGGKSANILLDDLDDEAFDAAVRQGVAHCFRNSGQACVALSRMLVPKTRLGQAVTIARHETLSRYQPGNPFDKSVLVGPVASQAQVARIERYITAGLEAGAEVVVGGPGRPEGLTTGYYVRPTVFRGVTNDMVIAQEEIFGPVLAMIAYEDDDDAVRIANDTKYGLSGAVQSGDTAHGLDVAQRLRTGQVAVNNAPINPVAPFGGVKQSGYGLEQGVMGLEDFLVVKTIRV